MAVWHCRPGAFRYPELFLPPAPNFMTDWKEKIGVDEDLGILVNIVVRKGGLEPKETELLALAERTMDIDRRRNCLRRFLRLAAMRAPDEAEELGVKPDGKSEFYKKRAIAKKSCGNDGIGGLKSDEKD